MIQLAVEAGALMGDRTGVGAVAARLLEGLADEHDLDISAFALSWRGREQLGDVVAELTTGRVRVIGRPFPARPLRRAWLRSGLPTFDLALGRPDVVWGPNFVVPPMRSAAQLVTVHDLTPLKFPKMCTADTLQYPELIRRAVQRGAWIHAVSQAVADEIVAWLPDARERTVVVHNGVSLPTGLIPAGLIPAGLTPSGPYIVAVGTIEPRKDLPGLVAAFDLIAQDRADLGLVLVGGDGWGSAALDQALAGARHGNRVVRTGRLPDAERDAIVQGAVALAYPSRYEGFGLPPLEAMALGTPVVATDLEVLREVLGSAALFVPADDPTALAAGLTRILDDATLRDDLRSRGLRQPSHWPWSDAVAGLADLIRRADRARAGRR